MVTEYKQQKEESSESRLARLEEKYRRLEQAVYALDMRLQRTEKMTII